MAMIVRSHPYGLTPMEQAIVGLLCERGSASRQDILRALYPERKAPPAPKIIDVVVCRCRRKLASAGVSIETEWGVGFVMPDSSRERVREISGGKVARI